MYIYKHLAPYVQKCVTSHRHRSYGPPSRLAGGSGSADSDSSLARSCDLQLHKLSSHKSI